MQRNGEWLELRLPRIAAASEAEMLGHLRESLGMPLSFFRRLQANQGIMTAGDRVRLRLFADREAGFAPEWLAEAEVLLEDDFVLVMNKPAGMKVHPTEPGETGTLANAVAFHYESTGQRIAVRHIHRLDEWTSGPVLYAKNSFAQAKLDEAMRLKTIRRTYAAVVQGHPRRRKGTIDAPIGRDRRVPGKRRVTPGGAPAVSHYEVVDTYKDASLLRVRLETGRTHQIRVHLSHIGHAIIGDKLYGRADSRIHRQALHGESLGFDHPLTGESIHLSAPMPEDMQRLIGSLSR